jgi:asparagine synthase (glutamine-hydrolysing)
MCGIAGSINCVTDNRTLSLISHRGPDRHELIELPIGNHKLYFGHARLSILDLSEAGNQPMFTDCKNYCIVYNGEIYNHEELRKKLTGINFKGHSDTETILYYIREFGIDAVKDFNGIFAFAFADLKNKKTYFVRDRFGIKPLYYVSGKNQFGFSSEIRPLRFLVKRDINKGVLLNGLKMRYCPSPLTIYQNIYKAEPGQIISCDLNSDTVIINKHYFLAPKVTGKRKDEVGKLVKIYGDLFEKAVERQLMADVEIGILLSGGIDSALVAAIAKQKSAASVKAFTIGFEGNYAGIDEIDYAAQTAATLGIEHFYKRVGFSDLFNSLRKIVKIVEEPIGTTSIIPMYYLSELAASKVKVVLSGQGADEPLGGYTKYHYLHILEKIRLFRKLSSAGKKFEFLYGKKEKIRRLVTAALSGDVICAYSAYNSIFSNNEISDLLEPSMREKNMEGFFKTEKVIHEIWRNRMSLIPDVKKAFLYYDLRTSLSDDLLMYTDKITMNFGLECRVPVLDNDLIEFIESLDNKYKFNSKEGKIIHKQFALEYLSAEIINRKKLGFQSPTDVWFRENRDEVERIILAGKQFKDIFDITAVKKLLAEHAGGKNREKQIFLLLSIVYLLEEAYEG